MIEQRERPRPILRGFRPVRNVDGGALLELVLVYAVATILGLRVYLEATGYPKVGGDGLHIAHMLWGGLLMLIALVLLIAFLGKSTVRLGAIAGGLGFGLFIDELGKFITNDNNYFYKLLLFFAFRLIERRRRLSQQEALVNAVDILKEVVRGDLDEKEKRQALDLLRQSDRSDPIVLALEGMLTGATPLPTHRPGVPYRLAGGAHDLYLRVVRRRWFPRALIALFTVAAVADFASFAGTIFADTRFTLQNPHLSFVDWGDLLTSLGFALLVTAGIISLRASRLTAYHWFRVAMLLSILLGQLFAFYQEQLVAIVGLAVNLIILAALNYTIGQEETGAKEAPVLAGAEGVT
jgi:hypothetical protein